MKANIFLKYIYRASYHMCVCVCISVRGKINFILKQICLAFAADLCNNKIVKPFFFNNY